MDYELTRLENPTLQLKVHKLFANPWLRSLRRAATSEETLLRLKSEPGAQVVPFRAHGVFVQPAIEKRRAAG